MVKKVSDVTESETEPKTDIYTILDYGLVIVLVIMVVIAVSILTGGNLGL